MAGVFDEVAGLRMVPPNAWEDPPPFPRADPSQASSPSRRASRPPRSDPPHASISFPLNRSPLCRRAKLAKKWGVGKVTLLPTKTGVLEYGMVTKDKRETTKGQEFQEMQRQATHVPISYDQCEPLTYSRADHGRPIILCFPPLSSPHTLLPHLPPLGWSTPLLTSPPFSPFQYQRLVYSHDDWVKHRSARRFAESLTSMFKSGVLRARYQEPTLTLIPYPKLLL